MRYLMFFNICLSVFILTLSVSYGKGINYGEFSGPMSHLPTRKDTIKQDSSDTKDTLVSVGIPAVIRGSDYLSPSKLSYFPAVSLQQALKGAAAGLYVQEPSGEPGTNQTFFIHGTPVPLLSPRQLFESQPIVILDGIPLVSEHPFAYDIQQYDFNRIGPATNPLTNIDMDNIESVKVLTGLDASAIYGPVGANGVILLTTKGAASKKRITFNAYTGLAQKPEVTTINGSYENAFRKQFYDLYTATGRYSEDEVYPLFLSDSLSTTYNGRSNWPDLYYNNEMVHAFNAGISGGTDRANFRFSLGNLRNQGVADNTALNRYSTMFNINMKPVQWLVFSAMVNANRVERDRNKNLRDRLAQVGYIPDLSSPLSPNKDIYGQYLNEFKKGFDNNKSNIVEGSVKIGINFGKFNFVSRGGVDYNEGYRDIFYPSTLLETNNYASNYFGYSQRLIFDNVATYDWLLNKNTFRFTLGQSTQWDTYKYNYAYAYKGPNDFVKLNLLNSDPSQENYLIPTTYPKALVYKFLDKTQNNLLSFYGKVDYSFNNKFSISGLLRYDGSSNAQPTDRWFYSPVVSGNWNIKNTFLADAKTIDKLDLRASAGRIGRLNSFDNYSQGPQYTVDAGFTGVVTLPAYIGLGELSRPYSNGWVGYDMPWGYSNQFNIGLDAGVFNDRLHASFDVYTKTDKDLILGIPSYAEYGYSQSYESGMAVKNSGVDFMISADILKNEKKLSWTSSLNFNYNHNELVALPRGLQEIIINNKFLKVGNAVDQYWLLENNGIYTSDTEIPVVNGVPMKYNGVALAPGDPIWKDQNGDNVIDNQDKVLKGHSLPILSGGFSNDFRYRNWSLGFNLYYNLGRKVINQEMANRFDFVNRESNNDINSVKEITFWEKRGDYSKYPLYNPWSSVMPYRDDQDLFLENASFLKLRSVTIGYDLGKMLQKNKVHFERLFIYGTVNNVFTITPYTGQDPELVNYTGYDSGYGLPIPRTYTIGIKMDL